MGEHMKLTFTMKKTITIFVMALLLFVAPFTGQAEASTSKSEAISKTATSLTGIKYVYGGTTTSGFDCSGYVSYVFKQNGIDLARTSSGMYASGTAVKKADEMEFARLNAANTMFCEDAARKVAAFLDEYSSIQSYKLTADHLESLHPHNATSQIIKNN